MPNAPLLAPDRDTAWPVGRAKGGGTNYYEIPGVVVVGTITFAMSLNTDYLFPFWAASPLLIDQVAFEVTSAVASTNVRGAVYKADRDHQPVGAPLLDTGDISSAATGVNTYTPGTAVFLPRGRYLSVINSDGGPTLRAYRGSAGASYLDTGLSNTTLSNYQVGRSHAAFPTPGTAWTSATTLTSSGFFHPLVFRVSGP